MAFEEKGWKRRVINAIIFSIGLPFYLIKKIMDYDSAFEEAEEVENESE